MTDRINALSDEQRRQSDELGEMRKMHIELMRSVGELCGRLDVVKTQYENMAKLQSTMQSEMRAVSTKVDGLMLDQASNKFTMELVRKINNYVVMAAVSAIASGGVAAYLGLKGIAP